MPLLGSPSQNPNHPNLNQGKALAVLFSGASLFQTRFRAPCVVNKRHVIWPGSTPCSQASGQAGPLDGSLLQLLADDAFGLLSEAASLGKDTVDLWHNVSCTIGAKHKISEWVKLASNRNGASAWFC